MKATFIGGGSLRLLPILRAVFQTEPEVFRNGEIRLADRQLDRAEAVGRLLAACPEYQKVSCRIVCTEDLDAALKDTDVLYVTMGATSEPVETQAKFLAYKYGYFSSDQLSVNGAFLSLRLGGFILELARKLERLSPKALMLIFANPVAVYSNMVNMHTKIRALGICGGFNNHRWDLTRLCLGKNEFDPGWNVVAAGVNHLSFILRGDYKGEDLYSSFLPRTLNDAWKCMDCREIPELKFVLEDLYRLYRIYNTLVFSTEGDGFAHVAYGDVMQSMKQYLDRITPFDPEQARLRKQAEVEKRFSDFIALSKTPEKVPWELPLSKNPLYGMNCLDITIPILRAVAGIEKQRIVASRPNFGVIAGLPENAAAEYTIDIFKDVVTPVENQYVPHPFEGLIASLAEFQTLLADALAEHDPQLFAAAFDAYPVNRFHPERKEFLRKMFELYTDVDPVMREAQNMIF